MAKLRLFAQVREAAGTNKADVAGDTVAQVLANASDQFGEHFVDLLPICRVWVNGEPAEPTDPVSDSDEVALLPPVSGG